MEFAWSSRVDDTIVKFSEYGLLGICLAMACWIIRHLYLQLDQRTSQFAEKITEISDQSVSANKELLDRVEKISDENRKVHADISDKYIDLQEKTMQEFKDMHTQSIEAIIRGQGERD